MNVITLISILALSFGKPSDNKSTKFLWGEWEKVSGSTSLNRAIFYPTGSLTLRNATHSIQSTYRFEPDESGSFKGYLRLESFGKELSKTSVTLKKQSEELVELTWKGNSMILRKTRTIVPGFQPLD